VVLQIRANASPVGGRHVGRGSSLTGSSKAKTARSETRGPRQGAYITWRSHNPRHVALMDRLAAQAIDNELARLWLAVIDQALVDAFILSRATKADFRLRRGVRVWFYSRRFQFACDLAGIDWAWAGAAIEAYAGEWEKAGVAKAA